MDLDLALPGPQPVAPPRAALDCVSQESCRLTRLTENLPVLAWAQRGRCRRAVQSARLARQQTFGDPWDAAALNSQGNVIAVGYAARESRLCAGRSVCLQPGRQAPAISGQVSRRAGSLQVLAPFRRQIVSFQLAPNFLDAI